MIGARTRRLAWGAASGAALLVAALCSFGCCFFWDLRAARAEALLQVLLVDRGSLVLTRKILAEGRYAGFAFVDVEVAGNEPIAEALTRTGAAAAIEVTSEQRVSLRVASTEQTDSQLFVVQRAGEAEAFPLRIIEELRARLVDLGWAVRRGRALQAADTAPIVVPAGLPPAASSPSGDSRESEPSSAGNWRVWLDGGLSVLEAAGGLGVTMHGVLGARLESNAAWGLGALALLPLHQNEVSKSQGGAEVEVYLYLLQFGYSLPLAGRWLASTAAGPGLAVLPLAADVEAPWIGKKDRLLCGVGHLELSLVREFGGWLRLRASLLGGWSAPRPVLSFAGQEAASWGRFFGTLSLRGEVGLPSTLDAQ